MSNTLLPKVDNLAWAPHTDIDGVDFLDRYNGVPTLGIIRTRDSSHLFWKAYGYSGDLSLWLYIPVTADEEAHVNDAEGVDCLTGIVYGLDSQRFASLGVAVNNRLIFDREWWIPAHLQPEGLLPQIADYVCETINVAIQEGLPASRRDVVLKARDQVKELAAC